MADAIAGTSEALVSSAFDALTRWSDISFAGIDSLQMQGIQGAIMTISRCIRDSESRKYELTRQLGLHFRSPNIGVAFCAIRQFDVYILRPYTIFVADQLVSVASAAEVPASPSPMSLRGIAFKVLFDLDQNFRTWPQLSIAYEECISGCHAWALDWRHVNRGALWCLLKYRT